MALPQPLTVVTGVTDEKPGASAIAHIVSSFLDTSVEIPLAHACAFGSLQLLDRLWAAASSDTIDIVGSSGWYICKSLRSDRHYYRAQFSCALLEAVRRNDEKMVRWIFAHFAGCVASKEVVGEAAGTGSLRMLKLLLELAEDPQLEQAKLDSDANWDGTGNVVTWGGNDMSMAAKGGYGEIVRWLHENTAAAERDLRCTMKHAMRNGDMELVQWLLANLYTGEQTLPPPEINDAAGSGHVRLVELLVEKGYASNACYALVNAAKNGHLAMVHWLAQHKIGHQFAEEAITCAAENGHFAIVQWLCEYLRCKGGVWAMHKAAVNGHLEIARFLRLKGFHGCSGDTMRDAARQGHLEVVQWLLAEFGDDLDAKLFHESQLNCFWMRFCETAMEAAASNGHLDVLKFLHEVGQMRTQNAPSCTTSAMDLAAGGGHLEVVRWLHNNRSEGCTANAMAYAALNGHLDTMKWLYEHTKAGCTASAVHQVAESGDLVVLKWLHEKYPQCFTTETMDRAARGGRLGVLQWLHTHHTEGCTSQAMNDAARGGHLHVVRWLHIHRREGCTTDAMDHAAAFGHFEVVLFLHSQRMEGCSPKAKQAARSKGYRHIAHWLEEHYPSV